MHAHQLAIHVSGPLLLSLLSAPFQLSLCLWGMYHYMLPAKERKGTIDAPQNMPLPHCIAMTMPRHWVRRLSGDMQPTSATSCPKDNLPPCFLSDVGSLTRDRGATQLLKGDTICTTGFKNRGGLSIMLSWCLRCDYAQQMQRALVEHRRCMMLCPTASLSERHTRRGRSHMTRLC